MATQLRELSRTLRTRRIGAFPRFRGTLTQARSSANISRGCTCLPVEATDGPLHHSNAHSAYRVVRNFSMTVHSEDASTPSAAESAASSGTRLGTEASASAKAGLASANKVHADDGDHQDHSDLQAGQICGDIPAGDLSDCPPVLHEFVFTSPPPFPFTVDPEALQPSQIKEAIRLLFETSQLAEGGGVYAEDSRWCAEEVVQAATGDEKWLQYPEPNVLWPNPLLHNHRLQPFTCAAGTSSQVSRPSPSRKGDVVEDAPGELGTPADGDNKTFHGSPHMNKLQLHLNRLRLEQLWKYSSVHGTSWDEIDEVYLNFKRLLQQRQQRWEARKQQLLEYSGVVCARRLRAQRLEFVKSAGVDLTALDEETREQLLVPRSLFRRMTRRLFYKWHDEYFAPWRPGGLQSVLKAHITLQMLQRETNERFLLLDPPATVAKNSAHAEAATSGAGSLPEPPSEASQSRELLEQKLRNILRRPYMRKPVGCLGGGQSAPAPQRGDPSTADDEELDGVKEANGHRWDFAGIGRRGRNRKAPVAKSTEV